MSGHVMPQGPFRIPAFREFVPRRLQPWIYVVFAFCFQLSGARYLGNLNAMMGGEQLMREDLLMCLYANLAGMAMYFPLLFRMKFRFTNKTLLTAAALGVALCNIGTAYVNFLPLLWLLCFVEGIFKLQGTFECVSNIQLWMTPRRDFTVFFPLLHLFIMGSMHVSNFYSAYFGFWGNWRLTHWFTAGLMLCILLVLQTCTTHRRLMPKQSLAGIDWMGWLLWSLFWLQVAFLLDYGDWYAWYDSTVVWQVTGTSLITLALAVRRMQTADAPFISPAIFRFRYVKLILVLIIVIEVIMGTEHVLEEVIYEDSLHYGEWTKAQLELWALAGCWTGCLFSLVWMKVLHFSYIRLCIVGIAALLFYLVTMYTLISPHLSIQMLHVPVFARGFAAAVISIMLMTSLQDSMNFQTFFQGLSLFNTFHMFIGGCIGGAIYAKGIGRYMTDGFARTGGWFNSRLFLPGSFNFEHYMEYFVGNQLAISVKALYGWVIFACVFLFFAFLLYDSPLRRQTQLMPRSWRDVALRRLRRHRG